MPPLLPLLARLAPLIGQLLDYKYNNVREL